MLYARSENAKEKVEEDVISWKQKCFESRAEVMEASRIMWISVPITKIK